MRTFTRFPTFLRQEIESNCTYEIEIFGELKLSWGIEFLIFRMSILQGTTRGISEVRFLPKDEFSRCFSEFTEVPNPGLH